MPAYPFIAIFLAQYALYITEYRTKVTRVFAAVLVSITIVIAIAAGLTMTGVINPATIASQYTSRPSTLLQVRAASGMFSSCDGLTISIVVVVCFALIMALYQMFKKVNIKILYSTIALTFAINLMIDGVVMRGIRKAVSSRPFAEKVMKEYPLDGNNMYVMNNLKAYRNLYGLNFYLGNRFHNFEQEMPREGYFFSTAKDLDTVRKNYEGQYTFDILTSTGRTVQEVRSPIVLCRFLRTE